MPELARKQPFYEKKPYLTAFLFYFVALLFVFAPVLTKPFLSPDSLSQSYPAYSFMRSFFLEHFSLPFWYPYISGGTPFLEGLHPNYLMDFVVYFFPIDLGIGYRAMLFVLAAGFFSFVFFRSLKLGFGVSLAAGLIYMVSSNTVTYTALGHYGKIVNMAFLPLAFFFINKAIEKSSFLYYLFAGLPLAIMFKGHPQVFFYNLLIISAYWLYITVTNYISNKNFKNIGRSLIGFAIMGVTTLILCFDSLYGQMSFLKMTSRGAGVDPAQAWDFATSWSLHPLELLGYILPGVFGLHDQTYLGWRPFVSTSDYVGLAVFFLAIYGVLVNWKKDKTVRFIAIVSVICIFFGFGKFFAPYYKLFYNFVPMIKSFRVPSTIYIVLAFFLVWFFALGTKSLMETNLKQPKEMKNLWYMIIAILVSMIGLSVFVGSAGYREMMTANIAGKMDIAGMVAQYGQGQVDSYVSNIISGTVTVAKNGLSPLWIVGTSTILLFLLLGFTRLNKKIFLFLLVLICFFDLHAVNKQFVIASDRYTPLSQATPDISFMQKDPAKFRILPFPPQIDNDSNKWPFFKLESAFGYNAIALKEFDDISRSGLLYDLKFLGAFNVKYLLSKQMFKDPRIEPVFQSGNKVVLLNKLWLERAFFVPGWHVIKDPKEQLLYLKSPEFDPQKTILLSSEPEEAKTALIKGAPGANTIVAANYGMDKIDIKVKVTSPAFLYLSEVYFPKWQCFVDGKQVKIYKANYMFRAAWIPEGEHTVIFKYRNDGTYVLFTLISLLSTIVVIILILKKRKEKDVPDAG